MSIKSRSNQGFTLVELIIVIVVIAVLSTIGVVGFNSIGTRAEESKLQSDINGAIKKIAADMVDSEVPPANADGLPKSDGVNYQYTQEYDHYRGEVYCITATSTKNGVKTYHSDNGSAPKEGACPGHGYGTGSPSSPSVVGPQKLNTFVASIKAHAQANGLTMADYSHRSSEPTKLDNALAANPGLSVGGSYLTDSDGHEYGIDMSDLGPSLPSFISASTSVSGDYRGETYIMLRPSDGLIIMPAFYLSGDDLFSVYTMGEIQISLLIYGGQYVANQLDTTVEQVDAGAIAGSLNNLFGMSILTSVSGGPGGPWVFGLNQTAFEDAGINIDVSSCRYNVSNAGQGYIKLDSYSC